MIKGYAINEKRLESLNKTITITLKELIKKFGRVFSCANVWNIITFYKDYHDVQTLSERLSWSHYCRLLSIFD